MLLRLDELNGFKSDLERYKGNPKKIKDLMLDWLLLAYADGVSDVVNQLGREWSPTIERVEEVIEADVGGMTVDERVDQDIYLEDYEALIGLAENERQRVYNTASYDTATAVGAKTKTWHTMEDNKVRDTHEYIDRMTKPIDEPFYTYTGDSAMYPQGFGDAANNINCRCWLTYT